MISFSILFVVLHFYACLCKNEEFSLKIPNIFRHPKHLHKEFNSFSSIDRSLSSSSPSKISDLSAIQLVTAKSRDKRLIKIPGIWDLPRVIVNVHPYRFFPRVTNLIGVGIEKGKIECAPDADYFPEEYSDFGVEEKENQNLELIEKLTRILIVKLDKFINTLKMFI